MDALLRSPKQVASSCVGTADRPVIKKHTKSRTGCKTCRRRKVKCDEKRPSCGNCLKNGAHCDFASLVFQLVGTVSVKSVPSLNLLDLELLNNFTSSTSNTIAKDATIRNVWKTAVVQRALQCDFLMRALLALSATHVAQNRPGRRNYYLSHAVAYHKIASRTVDLLMEDISPANAEDLWIFSMLTMYYASGIPWETDSSSIKVGDDTLARWTSLSRNIHRTFSVVQSSCYNGPLAPLLERCTVRWTFARRPEYAGANVLNSITAYIDGSVNSEADKTIYMDAILELECQLKFIVSPNHYELDLIDAFMWHFSVAGSLMPLVQHGQQEAVAIFAHSLVIYSAVNLPGWLCGLDTRLLASTWALLDAEHRLWIQWPIEQIGWVVPSSHLSAVLCRVRLRLLHNQAPLDA